MKALGPKLPLSIDKTDGIKMQRQTREMIKQHFKMLLLTSPGERVTDNDYGIGLRDFLFEKDADDLEGRIRKQVSKYLSYITIDEIDITIYSDTFEMSALISYFIPSFGASDRIELNVGR